MECASKAFLATQRALSVILNEVKNLVMVTMGIGKSVLDCNQCQILRRYAPLNDGGVGCVIP
jgi:hypothetical protein